MNGCCLINHRCEILSGDRVLCTEYLVEKAFTEHTHKLNEKSMNKKKLQKTKAEKHSNKLAEREGW